MGSDGIGDKEVRVYQMGREREVTCSRESRGGCSSACRSAFALLSVSRALSVSAYQQIHKEGGGHLSIVERSIEGWSRNNAAG
jgi:hypothetical protein